MKIEDIPDLIPRLAYSSYGKYKGGWKSAEAVALGAILPLNKGWKSEAIDRLPWEIREEVMRLRHVQRANTAELKAERKAIRRKAKLEKKAALRSKKINANRRSQAKALGEKFIPFNPPNQSFYSTWEWKKARFETIKRYGAKCMLCGSEDRIVVDHIKPRKKYPDLELDLNNLQVLCNDCNMGKSNDDFTDFRPGLSFAETEELDLIAEAERSLH